MGERNNSIPTYEYSWHLRNKKGEQLQSSFEKQECKEAIQDHYV